MDISGHKKIIASLLQIGLEDKQARVYLSTLGLGATTIQNIASASGLKRTTVYHIIESLRNLGLVTIEIKGFKKRYVAAPPEQLEATINAKREILVDIMPNLQSIYNLKGDESSIKYYKGLRACQGVYWGLLDDIKPHNCYLVMTDQERWYHLDPEFADRFIAKRAKLNIDIRLLFQDSPIAREHQKFQQNFNETIKILPASTPLNTNLIITPQKVVVHQLIPPIFTMVIENQSIIQMNREMFEIMWRSIN